MYKYMSLLNVNRTNDDRLDVYSIKDVIYRLFKKVKDMIIKYDRSRC